MAYRRLRDIAKRAKSGGYGPLPSQTTICAVSFPMSNHAPDKGTPPRLSMGGKYLVDHLKLLVDNPKDQTFADLPFRGIHIEHLTTA